MKDGKQLADKVKKHLKEDIHESKESIREDKALIKKLPKRTKTMKVPTKKK